MDIYDEESFSEMLGTDLEDKIIKHYGTPRHSGRYPWGSGENPYQHEDGWLKQYREYKAQGLSETEIAKKFDISTTILRNKRKAAEEADLVARATYVKKMLLHGYTPTTLSRLTGWNESTIRGLRDYVIKEKQSRSRGTADMLIREFQKKGWLDVGKGVDKEIGVSESTLKAALQILKEEGYDTVNIQVPQANNPDQHTTVKVLCKKGTTQKEIFKNIDQINTVVDYSPDYGKSYDKPQRPAPLDGKRVFIRYGDEGGSAMDGTIELRPGIDELSLGNNHYAQVRINVDDKSYMKGMAFYSNDIPEGYDVVYNTNKPKGTPAEKVYKALKPTRNGEVDWDNPFGAVIRKNGQREYIDINGEKKLSPINIIKQEGDWDSYSKSLSSQFLSKQKKEFVQRQLKLTLAEKQDEYNDILNIKDPTVRAKFLKDFAESCDSDAVELKATAVPGQNSRVILPVNDLKDNEVYAPGYQNGSTVCLVRYPHGGVFEIPMLTVNNNNKQAKERLGNATDAIGINTNVAGVLSGADFDGDSVIVIPQTDKVKTTVKKPYKELEGWSEKMNELYAGYEGMPKMTDREKQKQMGIVSNLITDMTIQGAPDDKIVRAVKQSMVVIDAQKHGYNWKQSEKDLGIAALKQEYQKDKNPDGKGGASTLISRAGSEVHVPKRALGYSIDPETGAKIYRETGESYFKPKKDRKGNIIAWEEVKRTSNSTQMAETDDARKLSSGTMVEEAYANYANALKTMANEARKKSIDIQIVRVDPALKNEYKDAIDSLNAKVAVAEANAPKERIAQVRANARIRQKQAEMPELKTDEYKKDLKKLRQISIADARSDVGASKKEVYVHLTDREKEAIENGAVSSTLKLKVMNNMDKDELREFVMPSYRTSLPQSKINFINSMKNSGFELSEIKERLKGIVPESTLEYYFYKE